MPWTISRSRSTKLPFSSGWVAGGLPASAELDPFKIREALGFIQILEPNEDFSDLFYRLYGTKLLGVVGDDFTGLWVSEIPVGIRALLLDQYLAVCVQRQPIYSENDTKWNFPWRRVFAV